jgi:DNA-binding transcriptional regulator PaaX
MKYADYADVLDLFDISIRPMRRSVFYELVLGYDGYGELRRARQLAERLQQRTLISPTGKRRDAFVITATGAERRRLLDPVAAWQTPWDGAWRVLTFDLPETRRKDRKRLWQALRARKLGLLQRSVWVWPHNLQPILRAVMEVEGLPECFCGFTAKELFLCTTTELVQTAWPWEEISRRHQSYRQHCVARLDTLRDTDTLAGLAKVARIEQQAYAYAFSFDPLLPRGLWPAGYGGEGVQERHRAFRQLLRRRYEALAAAHPLSS